MKRSLLLSSVVICTLQLALAVPATAYSIRGDYLEVRSCDVYTGPCFANGEMGLAGKEGILVWSIREGGWNGVDLAGLGIVAVVKADATLGDLRYQPRSGDAVLIVDAKANAEQAQALIQFARSQAGSLIREVVRVTHAPLQVAIGTCSKSGCALVKAGKVVEISTRCLGGEDHICGNEETYYPPLTEVVAQTALPAYAKLAAYRGQGLGLTWELVGKRSAYLAAFAR